MKTALILITLLGLSLNSFCQDIIFHKKGYQIESIVLQVTPHQVEYKRFDNLEGPTYIILKEDVIRIEYKNRTKDVFVVQDEIPNKLEKDTLIYQNGFWGLIILKDKQKISTSEVRKIFKNDSVALSLFNAGKTQNTVANIIGIPSGFVFGWGIGTLIVGGEVNPTAMIISGVGVTTSLILSVIGNNNIKKSVRVYNSKGETSNPYSLNFGLTTNGIGLCFKF